MQETRQPLTDQTWAMLDNRGLIYQPPFERMSWMRQADLEHEAHERTADFCPIGIEGWRALVAATVSGLPVVITRRNYNGTETATYMVDQILSLSSGTTANLYVRRWGFSYPLALGDLISVETPDVTYERTEA